MDDLLCFTERVLFYQLLVSHVLPLWQEPSPSGLPPICSMSSKPRGRMQTRESELLFDESWLNNFLQKVYRDLDTKISKWPAVINSVYWNLHLASHTSFNLFNTITIFTTLKHFLFLVIRYFEELKTILFEKNLK